MVTDDTSIFTIVETGERTVVAFRDWRSSLEVYYESGGDVFISQARRQIEHLRDEHDLDLPKPDVILRGRTFADPITAQIDDATDLVIRRLREALDIDPTGGTKVSGPTLGKLTSN